MNNKIVLDMIKTEMIVAIVRSIPTSDVLSLGNALLQGGISCIEVTFDQTSPDALANTLESIRILKEAGNFCVGAGTVMTEEQVIAAAEAGAEYMISPNVDAAVIEKTKELGKISIPGALTPTEIVRAYELGADIVKIFPAGSMGASYIKALKAPLAHIPLMAVGGINPQNCGEYLAAGAIGVGCGGNLVNAKLVRENKFDEITLTAKAYKEACLQHILT